MLKIDITDILDEFIIYWVSNILWEIVNEYKVFKLWKWQILNINWLEKDIVRNVAKSKQQEYFFKIITRWFSHKVLIEEISEEKFNKIIKDKEKKWVIKTVLEKTWLLKKN